MLPTHLLFSPQNGSNCHSPHTASHQGLPSPEAQTPAPQPPLLRLGSTNPGGVFDPRSRNHLVSFSDQYGSDRSRRFTISSQPLTSNLTLQQKLPTVNSINSGNPPSRKASLRGEGLPAALSRNSSALSTHQLQQHQNYSDQQQQQLVNQFQKLHTNREVHDADGAQDFSNPTRLLLITH